MAKKKMRPSAWIDALMDSVNQHFWLETTDGVEREGKVTGFGFRTFELNGETVEVPVEIEINNDSMDKIPLDRVLKIRIG